MTVETGGHREHTPLEHSGQVVPRSTGEPPVDAALARLHGLAGRPATQHVEVYEDVHRRLQDALSGAAEPDPGAGRDQSSEHDPSGPPSPRPPTHVGPLPAGGRT